MATDFHLAQKSVQLTNIFPWVWKETAVADGLGEYYAISLWSQPMHTVFGLMAFLNIPFEIQTKLLGLMILLLGFWGIWRLLDQFKINTAGKSVGSIFFLLNSFFLLLFDGGQLSLALAYCTLPVAYFYFLKVLKSDKSADKLKFAAWVLLLSIFDIRIVYLLTFVILVFLIFRFFTTLEKQLIILKRFALVFLITGIILMGFHAFWLWPALASKPIQLPQTYDRTSQISFLSFSSLQDSILLQQPHWPQNVFGRISNPRPEFMLIPLLVFSSLILIKKNKQSSSADKIVGFWLLISVVTIFLSKGSNEPFPQVYSFLFTYIPGFSFFRDPTKFYFLITLSYSILIAFSVQSLSKYKIIPLLLLLYFTFLARPLYLGQMTGMISSPKLQKEFIQLGNILNNNDSGRVFWIPSQAPLGYTSTLFPSVSAAGLSQKRPFAVGIKGPYETFNFLREAPYMGEIFDVSGIGYIAYPYLDPRRDDMHTDNVKYFYTFLDQLSKRPWLTKVEDSSIPLLKTTSHQSKFFVAPNVWWVIGSDSLYNEATKSAGLKLAKNALIFAEEYPGLGKKIDKLPEAKIVLNHKTGLDLAASFLNPKDLIFPAKNLGFDPDLSGWWKREAADLVRWRSFLQGKYGIDNTDFDLGGGWAVGEKSLKLAIQDPEFGKDKILLARLMESSKSGELKFYQANKLVGEIKTMVEGDANVRWFEVGNLSSGQELTISSEGDINVVNALAVVNSNEWSVDTMKAKSYSDQGRIVDFNEKNTQAQSPEVKYQEIDPTKFRVSVKGLNSPAFLVFSQNYDGLWKMNNESSLPVYSLLNGFNLDHDGDYVVEFQPQRYIYPGLIITGITISLLCLLLYRSRKSADSK